MTRSILIRAKLLCAALIILAVAAGCGGGGGDTTPPTIANAMATVPSDFSFDGGPVGITAGVSDSGGIAEVHAVVTRPDASDDPNPVAMAPGSGVTFDGTYTAIANTREDGVSEEYSVVIIATDNAGNHATSSTFVFQVPAPESPGDGSPF